MSIDREWLQQIIADDESGLLAIPVKQVPVTNHDRLVSGFQEVTAFIEEHGRAPEANVNDIREFQLHARLQGITNDPEHRAALADVDHLGLLVEPEPPASLAEVLASDAAGLLDVAPEANLFDLRNVPAEIKQPDRVAKRKPCTDFADFEAMFGECHADLRSGRRKIIEFRNESQISADSFFVYRGVLTYVAHVGELTRERRRPVARLRCIFENGTESDLLLRSLARELYKHGRRITEPSDVTLERMGLEPGTEMGCLYVLRSLSTDPQVTAVPDLHKIGFTTRTTAERVKQANEERTYLRAPVEIVAEYQLPASMASGVEAKLHQFFGAARVDVHFNQDGERVSEATEWFSVPLPAIDQAVELLNAETIMNYEFVPAEGAIRLRGGV